MSIKRYVSSKDNTLTTGFRENLSARGINANMGASDILEIFSIFGQASSSSVEQSRVILQFPIEEIVADRNAGLLPESGSVEFRLKIFNARHGQTTPQNFEVSVLPVLQQWSEGDGLDMESYLDLEASNWMSASDGVIWHNSGSDYASSAIILTSSVAMPETQTLEIGTEDINVNITSLVEEWITFGQSSATHASGSINFLKNVTDGNSKAQGKITISGNPGDENTFTLSDTSGFQTFIIHTDDNDFDGTSKDGSGRVPIGILGVMGNNDNIAERIKTAINGQTTVAISASRSNDEITLTQQVEGSLGNTTIDVSGLSNSSKVDFVGGLDAQTIKIYSHEGESYSYTFVTSSSLLVGNSWNLQVSASAAATAASLQNRINLDFNSKITTNLLGSALQLTQSVEGFHGNTFVSSSVPEVTASVVSFNGGEGMPNYGVVLKLSDSYEDGSRQKSYYTKKFYSRSSHEYYKKPIVEAQWESNIKDDRNYILKSSSLSTGDNNLNNIYLYNKQQSGLEDIPSTGSALLVQLFPSLGGAPESLEPGVGPDGVIDSSKTFITASRVEQGVYKASFSYTGSFTELYDVWSAEIGEDAYETFITGSKFIVHTSSLPDNRSIPDYNVNITNLKDTYLHTEKTTLRVYTRNKNWQPNIYNVASNSAPVNNIKNLFYRIVRVSDNHEVIGYSTGSTTNYSGLSYDKEGSFFDLDMSLFEHNNAYEITFVFKDGSNYREQKEKFRFRVEE